MYKNSFTEKKNANYSRNILVGVIFFSYIVAVIYATFFSERLQYETINLKIFSSYFYLLEDFSYRQWFQMVGNILLFIPIGGMLPIILKKFSKFQYILFVGLALSACIELLQYITKRGVLDVDDIINNMLGVILGYCCFKIFSVFGLQKLKNPIRFAIPFMVVIIIYSLPIIEFYGEGIGNITEFVYRDYDMDSVSIESGISFSKSGDTGQIYQSERISKKEADKFAVDFFNQLGYEIDSSQTLTYEDCKVYYSADRDICLWIYYLNSNFWYSNFGNHRKLNDDVQNTLHFLSELGFVVPDNREILEISDGHTIYVNHTDGENIVFGSIHAKVAKSPEVLQYSIANGHLSKEVPIISEQEAFDKLKRGEFYTTEPITIQTLSIRDIEKSFTLDTKGYLQPIYVFQTTVNNGNDIQNIMVSAISEE